MAPALWPVFAASGSKSAHLAQVRRPARSSAEVMELDVEGSGVRGEASSRVKICLETSPSSVYGEGNPLF